MESLSSRALFEFGQVSYKWIIHQFEEMVEFEFYTVKSENFKCNNINFFLQLSYLKLVGNHYGYNSRNGERYVIECLCPELSVESMKVIYKVTLRNNKEEKITLQKNGTQHLLNAATNQQLFNYDLIYNSFEAGFKGYLTVDVDLKIKRLIKVSNCDLSRERNSSDTRFESLLEDPRFADVTIKTADREFKAHRAILAHRSPVFAAMFQEHTREAATSEVCLEDIESTTIEAMLAFIYTDSVPDMQVKAEDILPVAEKYSLEGLKTDCENALLDNLSEDNVFQRFQLANLYNCETLLINCSHMIRYNFENVSQTNDDALQFFSDPNILKKIFYNTPKK